MFDYDTNDAVLLIAFNRPNTTRQVIEIISTVQPKRLYFACDGARNSDEVKNVREVRSLVSSITWPCAIMTKFSDSNLGCKNGVSSAIDWFFEHEERGIILEDDCLPSSDFFGFCSEMLRVYASDRRVMMVSGNNVFGRTDLGKVSHYFSNIAHIWGWATWRRSWILRDLELRDWKNFVESREWRHVFPDLGHRQFWARTVSLLLKDGIDTWDYYWQATMWKNSGVSVVPSVNLVSNIGFGPDATHTLHSSDPFANMPRYNFDLSDNSFPSEVVVSSELDSLEFKKFMRGRRFHILPVISRVIWEKIIKYLKIAC